MHDFQLILSIISIMLLTLLVIMVVSNSRKKPYKKYNQNKVYTFSGNMNKYLLTKTELSFFNKLKIITDRYDLLIFPKIRMADIISTTSTKELWKVSSKHIDFTICMRNSMPLVLIELDDSSHNKRQNKINDAKLFLRLDLKY